MAPWWLQRILEEGAAQAQVAKLLVAHQVLEHLKAQTEVAELPGPAFLTEVAVVVQAALLLQDKPVQKMGLAAE